MSEKYIVEGSPAWESICQQCGICCLAKFIDKFGNVFLTNVRCAALDKDTRKCRCYAAELENRDNGCENCSELNGICVTRLTLNNDYTVPSFCPYAQKFCENPAIKKSPKNRPTIDWENTVSETEIGGELLATHVIPGSNKYFKYNPQVSKILHENMKVLSGR